MHQVAQAVASHGRAAAPVRTRDHGIVMRRPWRITISQQRDDVRPEPRKEADCGARHRLPTVFRTIAVQAWSIVDWLSYTVRARMMSPLGWDHVNLTGDYVWSDSPSYDADGLRPLNREAEALAA